jgi:hypothetical protein
MGGLLYEGQAGDSSIVENTSGTTASTQTPGETTLFSLPLTPYPATPTPGNTGILYPHKCIEKADDADERDTNVQGYTNSSTKKGCGGQ